MSTFAQYGKKMWNASVTLTTAGSFTAFTPISDEFADVYSIVLTTNDTAAQILTISDGVTTLTYLLGGGGSAGAAAIVDQSSVPVRFKKGTAITVTLSAITGGKTHAVNIRGLTSKT